MSLLLEALKKAELAKQSADTSPATESAPPIDPVITRDTLPDISQPLEIRANDLPSAGSQTSYLQLDPAPTVSPLQMDIGAGETMNTASTFETAYSAAPPAAAPEPAGNTESERAAARQMFEAKEVDYNPKRPFYITLGVLGICAAGYAGYVWWQMQPRSVYSAAAAAKRQAESPPASPPPPAQAMPTGAATQTASAPATQPQASANASPAQAQTQTPTVTPGTAQTAAGRAAPVTPAAPKTQTAGTPSAAQPAARPAATRTARADSARAQEQKAPATPIAVNPPTLMVDPQIERAYEAFQQGDLTTSRSLYQSALQRDPSNRDGLLGLAAIDMRTRNFDLAEARYLKLLEADPRDALAMAGLIALRGQTDPLQSESRLKSLIAAHPDSAHLHFALGNQYAAMTRWPEAQAAYFKAYTLDPDNPDFAFNLAVSLDQMRQSKLALEYYRRALALASTRSTGFDRNQVSARISDLTR